MYLFLTIRRCRFFLRCPLACLAKMDDFIRSPFAVGYPRRICFTFFFVMQAVAPAISETIPGILPNATFPMSHNFRRSSDNYRFLHNVLRIKVICFICRERFFPLPVIFSVKVSFYASLRYRRLPTQATRVRGNRPQRFRNHLCPYCLRLHFSSSSRTMSDRRDYCGQTR